jgi:alpha,alpha-trehalase
MIQFCKRAILASKGIVLVLHRHFFALSVLVFAVFCSHFKYAWAQEMKSPAKSRQGLTVILDYITADWNLLTRSTATCQAAADPKLTDPAVLYLPADFTIPTGLPKLLRSCNVRVSNLPSVIREPGQVTGDGIHPPGLLFLENPYIVPGGRFNEMYGWDSYFIIRGLLRANKVELAKGMVENFFFEIEHYGNVLNANRTYYLTRSQPPFLSSMILAVHDAEKARGQDDRAWLARAYRYANQDYEMWMRAPHLAGSTGLSRFYDFGEGPVPEGLHDETGYYHDVLAYFVKQRNPSPYLSEAATRDALAHSEYSLELCEPSGQPASGSKCDVIKYVALSPEYYKGDRSMRESGFDISFRFGPYGADTHHYAPVCLNGLLYKTETDMEGIAALLADKQSAALWHQRAEKRKELIQKLLWNQQRGLFFDYDFVEGKQSTYEYATTFYPLWAGLATPEQARSLVKNLPLFEQAGGLAMSTKETGVQWDYPYGWAPIHLLAVEGLRRYGYNAEADRISLKFLSMVLTNFARDGNIREKYDVVSDSSNFKLTEGYRDNVVGFGWTNGVFLELLNTLPKDAVSRLGSQSSSDTHN